MKWSIRASDAKNYRNSSRPCSSLPFPSVTQRHPIAHEDHEGASRGRAVPQSETISSSSPTTKLAGRNVGGSAVASLICGKRAMSSSNMTRSSRRASELPRQK